MSPETGKSLQKALAEIPLHFVSGVFFRAVPEHAADYALEDGPSYVFNNRYNIANQFGALYFGDRAEVCRATLEKRGLLANRRTPYVLLSFDVQVDGILDLTDPEVLQVLHIHREQLVLTREQPSAYLTPQSVAMAAYQSGRTNGLSVPDVTETGNTLALYPARILTRDCVRYKERITL